MKITKYFRAFLEEHSYLAIPGIGRFELSSDDTVTHNLASEMKTLQFSQEAASNQEILDLVQYLCLKLHVEKDVARCDLDYFSITTREILLQGLEAEIPGLGFLNFDYNYKMKFSRKSRYKCYQLMN